SLGDSTTTDTFDDTHNANALIANTIIGQSDTAVEDFTGRSLGQGKDATLSAANLIPTDSYGYEFFAGGTLESDPKLGPLQNNGGPTPTLALQPGSPAIDAGINAVAVDHSDNPLTTDQRGQPRIVNGTVDIGAFEDQQPDVPIVSTPTATAIT